MTKFIDLFEIRLIFMKIALVVLIGLVLEILVWIGVGELVGSMWYVFFWFIVAFFIGLNLIRANSQGLMPQMQQMQMGQFGGSPELSGNLPKIIAGILLVIPGLITDVIALLLLLPPVQNAMKAAGMKYMAKKQEAMMNNMMNGMGGMGGDAQGQNPFADMMRQMQEMQNQQGGRRGSSIIDGEAHEVEPERKQIDFKDVTPK